jgi:secreted PhoX family phosphatase
VTNGNNSVSVFANNGSVLSPATGYTGGNLSSPSGVAIDGSGNVWITNAGNSSVTEILGGATPVSPTTNAVQNKTLGVRP